MDFKKFTYFFVILSCCLDVLTTFICLFWLKMPIENETNLMFRLLLANKLYIYYFTVNFMKICTLLLACMLIFDRWDKHNAYVKKPVIIGLYFLLAFPIVNNSIAILQRII